ncbi:MAG: hypothetical protein ABJB85_12340 [Nitrososphaerota archaeon]
MPFPIPLDEPKPDNIESWHSFLHSKFSLSGRDFIIFLPITEGNNVTERWDKFEEPDKVLWQLQVKMNVRRQYYYLKGFDASAGFFIPHGYSHLAEDCQNYFVDHPDYSQISK